jgi:hypothetical protein
LVYADDVNILGESAHTLKKNTEALVVVSRKTGLEVEGLFKMIVGVLTTCHTQYT